MSFVEDKIQKKGNKLDIDNFDEIFKKTFDNGDKKNQRKLRHFSRLLSDSSDDDLFKDRYFEESILCENLKDDVFTENSELVKVCRHKEVSKELEKEFLELALKHETLRKKHEKELKKKPPQRNAQKTRKGCKIAEKVAPLDNAIDEANRVPIHVVRVVNVAKNEETNFIIRTGKNPEPQITVPIPIKENEAAVKERKEFKKAVQEQMLLMTDFITFAKHECQLGFEKYSTKTQLEQANFENVKTMLATKNVKWKKSSVSPRQLNVEENILTYDEFPILYAKLLGKFLTEDNVAEITKLLKDCDQRYQEAKRNAIEQQ